MAKSKAVTPDFETAGPGHVHYDDVDVEISTCEPTVGMMMQKEGDED